MGVKVEKNESSKSLEGFPGKNKRSSSLESTKSTTGTIIPRSGPIQDITDHLYDCCAFVIICPEHKNMALTKGDKGRGPFLPSVPLKPNDSWQNTAVGGISIIVSHGDLLSIANMAQVPFTNPDPVHLLRIQQPNATKLITRIIYAVRITKPKNSEWTCCQNDKNIIWHSIDDIYQGKIGRLWGPEPQTFIQSSLQAEAIDIQLHELSLDYVLKYVPNDPIKSKEEAVLKSALFTEKEISKLFMDFIQHCYPSQFMTIHSFVDYMSKLGFQKNDPQFSSIFRAFNYRGNGALDFHELLLGLAAMDPSTHHGGQPGDLRCGYIFRYYDSNFDGLLDYQDMVKIVSDIFRAKELDIDEPTIVKEVNSRIQIMGLKSTDHVPFDVFLHSVGDLRFRGTSSLFRSTMHMVQVINNKKVFMGSQGFGLASSGLVRMRHKGICQSCRDKKYKLAVHSVKLEFSGCICDPRILTETEGKDITINTEDALTELLRKYSKEWVYNPNSNVNSVLETLRQFDAAVFKKSNKGNIEREKLKEWTTGDGVVVLNMLTALCQEAELIFSQESRCVKVNSPVFVFGDIHGNFGDLMTYERILWRMGPTVSASSYLFLGDYVDRGNYGVECVAYLLALKILAPHKYFLCRGNHEIRSIQKVFTFHKECVNKYGPRVGPQVWEVMNKAFEKMPICSVIDEGIYCAHGGIPTSVMKIEDIMKIPSPLPEPESESPAAWEIMWNDPMNPGEFIDMAEFMKVNSSSTHGFLSNTKRGTGFFYTEEAVNNFLDINGLTHIIRAHEVMPIGYKFHMGGKVMTIFSCARYCGGSNEAACVSVDGNKIRVIRLDTSGQQ